MLGGTKFVGRRVTDELVRRGHIVTLFNRGVTETKLRDDVAVVHGDRASDLQRLPRSTWDAVIDMCGYTPDVVRASAREFRDAGRYIFVSSISVYDVQAADEAPIDERFPVSNLPDGADRSVVTAETYGPLKALCEDEVRSVFADRATILRPGLIAGPHDPTDRFTYWPLRVAAGSSFLAPERPSYPLQYVDVDDVAAFTVTVMESQASGTYNVVTTPGMRTFGEALDACIRESGAAARPVWADADFLLQHGVAPWSDLPLWIPQSERSHRLLASSNARALSAGLRLRDVSQTVAATLRWAASVGKRFGTLAAGLSPEREAEIVAAFDVASTR